MAMTTLLQVERQLRLDYARLTLEQHELGELSSESAGAGETENAEACAEAKLSYINELLKAMGRPALKMFVELEDGKPKVFERIERQPVEL